MIINTSIGSLPRMGLGYGPAYPIIPRYGMGAMTFDGTGLFGTGLFGGDWETWGWTELLIVPLGLYALYAMVHQTKQTGVRLEAGARRRRVKRAAKYREKAKQLEAKTTGFF